jgi:uncharacterized protein YdeI (BOF family)
MNEDMLRFLLAAILFVGVLIIASLSGEMHYYQAGSGYFSSTPPVEFASVSELMQRMLLEEQVSVPGEVVRVLEDHVSKEGYEYQQFYITDGKYDLKIFCSKYDGPTSVKEEDNVLINGKFQKYYNEYEIYLNCKDVKII